MPPKASPAVAAAIVEGLRSGESMRCLAARLGVSEDLINNVVWELPAYIPPLPKGEIRFREVESYWCGACKSFVGVQPCPACLARRLKAKKRS